MRICPSCIIKWQPAQNDPKSYQCPKCGSDPEFTLCERDARTIKHFDKTGDTLDRYKLWPKACTL